MGIIPIENLVCPNCRGNLAFDKSGYLCQKCGTLFPVEGKIINLLPAGLERNKLNEERIWVNWANFNLKAIKTHEIRYFQDEILPNYDFCGRILEIGAGSCWASALLKLKYPNSEVYASDVSLNALKRGVKVAEDFESSIDFFVASDIERLPFKNGFFDWIIGNSVLHHLYDLKKGISEINRVLKNTGKYVGCGELVGNLIFKRVWASRVGRAGQRELREGINERVFTFKELSNLFNKCDFDIEVKPNKNWKYKTVSHPFTYLYYLAISKVPNFFVKKALATDVDLVATKKET